jgi:lysine/ornithine N-monooxygenase
VSDVAVIGAGPYGLSCAAHLRAAGLDVAVFGEPVGFWARHMPAGMRLRSSWDASTISDPRGELTLDAYESERRVSIARPTPLDDFLAYAHWFQSHGVGPVDPRRVVAVERLGERYRLVLDHGSHVARRVVVATGLEPFAHRPAHLAGLPGGLALHSADVPNPGAHAGERVAVVGAGQSAIELAALLAEAGAEVEVVARAPAVRWLARSWSLHSTPRPIQRLLYPPTDVGPPVLNRLVAAPRLFRRFPRPLQARIAYRCIRPAAAGWLTDRLDDVRLTCEAEVREATPAGDGLGLALSDGSRRVVDRLILATGYRMDLGQLAILPQDLRERLRIRDGYPVLGAGFESSLPGLHFVGAFSVRSFGPVMQFISGTWFTAGTLASHVLAHSPQTAPMGLQTVASSEGTA